jgi:G:T/U-mismatch repair DNA glycosylase
MESSASASAPFESIAERGLCAFLRAIAEAAPGADLKKAGDCWIRALERAEWEPSESAEKFIRHVTIHAMTAYAKSHPECTQRG